MNTAFSLTGLEKRYDAFPLLRFLGTYPTYSVIEIAASARAIPAKVAGERRSFHRKRAARLSRTTTVQPIIGKKTVPGTWLSAVRITIKAAIL